MRKMKVQNKIPVIDLGGEYLSLQRDIDEAVQRVLRSGHYVLGPELRRLEESLAKACGTTHAVGVNSGTDALTIILRSLGIGAGDEVITVPFTFFATVESIVHAGAKPVFVDIEPETFTISPRRVAKALSRKTKAVIAVHLYGQMADMSALLETTGKAGVPVIEDMAQALGAAYREKPAGSLGRAAALSFYPTKNLGACGDAGMILTRDEALAKQAISLRSHGTTAKYHYDEVGYNSRLDELQAAILNVKFEQLARWNERRSALAARYDRLLKGLPLTVPARRDASSHVYHLYTIRTARRDALQAHLKSHGIESGVHYPSPLHLAPALKSLGYQSGDFPESERAAKEVLSLPLHAQMSDRDVDSVAQCVKEFHV